MTDNTHARLHAPARRSFAALMITLGASVALLWGWNTLAVDLFQAPKAQFRHVLAAVAMLIAVAATWATITRLIGKGHGAD